MGSSNSSQYAGYSQNDSIFTQLWFWMIVVGVILLIIAAIDYAVRREARWWTWTLVGIGAGLVVLGIILGALYANRRPSYPHASYQQPGCNQPRFNQQPPVPQCGQQFAPQGVPQQPMPIVSGTQVAPTILPTPGAPVANTGVTSMNTPVLATQTSVPHTVITTSSASPVRVG